jgi:hypothetical protein
MVDDGHSMSEVDAALRADTLAWRAAAKAKATRGDLVDRRS